MGIQNFLQNAVITKDKVMSLWNQKTGNLTGYVTKPEKDANGNLTGNTTVVAKPSYDLTVEQPYEQSERAYEAAADKNPYSLENMVGGWVDDIKGEISEKSMLLFGSDEKIVEYYKNYSSIREQEKKQEKAQKEQDKINYENYKNAKQDMNYAELQKKLNKWTYDNKLREYNTTNKNSKNVSTGLQGTTADGDFEWF